MRLDRNRVMHLTGKGRADLTQLEKLDASKQGIEEVSELDYLPALNRLDLSNNKLHDVGAVAACISLKWLSLAANQVADVGTLASLSELQVLNVGSNVLRGKLRLQGLRSLGAFIANNNQLTSVKSLGEAVGLNTLVLKDNQIESIGSALQTCPALVKLSLAHNKLTEIGASLKHCQELCELRLSHNKLRGLPDALRHNTRLRILELGGNPISSADDIKVVRKLPLLNSLTLKGCPITEGPDYPNQITAMLPYLQILDGKRLLNVPRRPKPALDGTQPMSKAGIEADPGSSPPLKLPQVSVDLAGVAVSHENLQAGQVVARRGAAAANGLRKRKLEGGPSVSGRRDAEDMQSPGTKSGEESEPLGPKHKKKPKTRAAEDEPVVKQRQQSKRTQQPRGADSSAMEQPRKQRKRIAELGHVQERNMAKGPSTAQPAEVPAFLREVITGTLEAEQRGEAGQANSADEVDGVEELQQEVSRARPKKQRNTAVEPVRAGVHGAQVATALQRGLFDVDSGLGAGGPSAWD